MHLAGARTHSEAASLTELGGFDVYFERVRAFIAGDLSRQAFLKEVFH